jgi:hypothetical protein
MARGLVNRAPTISVVGGWGQATKAFVKREKAVTSISGKLVKAHPAPRIIQGRSLDVKVATGPFTWAFGKQVAKAYNPQGLFLYAGSRSSEEVGYFFDNAPAKCGLGQWYAVDCKRWDRSVGPTPLAMLWQEYKACGASKECLEALKGRNRKRFGVTSKGWKFSRVGQVASGDGDTSAGNSRLHLVMLEACSSVNAAVVAGDDCLVHTSNIDIVLSQYRLGGFEPVLANEIDFCSAVFWPTEAGSVLGPKIGRVLGKTFYCLRRFDDYRPWLRGVCLSLRNMCSFVPILRALVPRLLSLCGSGKVWRDQDHDYKIHATSSHEVVEETWAVFQDRYGLDESDACDLELQIATMQLGDELCDIRWTQIVERDIIGV